MSKKKNKKVSDGGNNENTQQKEEKESNNQKGDDGGKKEGGGGSGGVILKVDLHCEGCASKIVKFLRGFEGVEKVKVDGNSNKLTVTGKVDPVKIRERLEQKTHKKVELLSQVSKKDKEDSGKSKEDKDGKENKDKNADKKNNKKEEEENKSKESPVTTALMKVPLHCEGCIQKIYKIVTKIKGYVEMHIDKQKDLVTVKGSMDMKALAETLKKHLKKDVQIISPKKDEKKDKGNEGGGEGKSGGGGARNNAGDGGEKMEGNKMQVQSGQGVPNPYVYGPVPVDPYQFHHHAPQMFSDENPNACSVM